MGQPDLICHTGDLVKKTITVSELAGQIICDCPGLAPVGSAVVSYTRQTTPAEYKRALGPPFQGYVDGDAEGRFQINGAPAGTYWVDVGSLTFNSRAYQVKVVRDGKKRPPLSLAIVPNPAVAEYLRLHPRETAYVRTKNIPTYPLEALKAGIEGPIVIRVVPGKPPFAMEGHRLLALAAEEFAKTWETSSQNNEPFDVHITYRLTDGDSVGGGPRVVLRLPRQVEIAAKRIVASR